MMESKIQEDHVVAIEMHDIGNGERLSASSSYSTRQDDDTLQRMGKKPVLKRKFGSIAILGFCSLVISTWIGPFVTLGVGLTNGGPAGLIYSFVIVWIGNLATFACMAELASMAPTAGGQYHWVSMLAPKSYFKGFSYVTGWLTVTGWQAGLASSSYVTGTLVQGFIEIVHPTYVPKLWHATLLLYATVAFGVFCTTTLGTLLPKLEIGLLVLYTVGFFAVLIPIVSLGPHASAHSVFTTFINNGGWSSKTLSFFVGISGNAFAFLGADAMYHMSEEVHHASVVIPTSMMWCIVANGVVGLAMYFAILFCAGDLNAALESRFIYGFIEVVQQALNSTAGTALVLVVILLVDLGLIVGVVATSSRMLWSFARDHGVPGWRRLSKVNSITSIPTAAIMTTTVVSFLISLITIGSPVAFNDVISLTVGSLYASYFSACAMLLHRRVQGSIKAPSEIAGENHGNLPGIAGNLVWGPWRMPEPFGTVVNATACIYLVVVFFFSLWPPATPVTPATMNYSVVVLGAVAIFSAFYYTFWAHKTYAGPVIEVDGN